MTIKEVSKKYGLSHDTLRYYEKIGLIPRVNRNASGIRDYTEDDCRWVEFAKCMRSAGLEIKTLIEYLALFQEGDSTLFERKDLLTQQREQLADKIAEMQLTLQRLDGKIKNYDKVILTKERELKIAR